MAVRSFRSRQRAYFSRTSGGYASCPATGRARITKRPAATTAHALVHLAIAGTSSPVSEPETGGNGILERQKASHPQGSASIRNVEDFFRESQVEKQKV
jgi:poly(3-hydroxybutyrate) depolymerase